MPVIALLPALLGLALQAAPPQSSAPPTGQAAALAPKNGLIVLNYIRSDKAADFEAVITRVKEALDSSQVPERKQQAAGWRVFKSPERVGEGETLYIFVIDPLVKGADYSVSSILSEAFPAEAKKLYDLYAGAFAARGKVTINADLLVAMGAAQ